MLTRPEAPVRPSSPRVGRAPGKRLPVLRARAAHSTRTRDRPGAAGRLRQHVPETSGRDPEASRAGAPASGT